MRANGFVEGKLGFYQQTPLMRTINIDSELRNKAIKRARFRRIEEPAAKKVIKILDLEKALDRSRYSVERFEACGS